MENFVIKSCLTAVETKMILPIKNAKEELILKNNKIQEEIPELEALVATQKRQLDVLHRTISELLQTRRMETPLTTELRKVYDEIGEPYEGILQNLLGRKEIIQKNIQMIAEYDLRLSVINHVISHFVTEQSSSDNI